MPENKASPKTKKQPTDRCLNTEQHARKHCRSSSPVLCHHHSKRMQSCEGPRSSLVALKKCYHLSGRVLIVNVVKSGEHVENIFECFVINHGEGYKSRSAWGQK